MYPNDVIVADGDGAVVVPASMVDEVAALATEQERLEAWIMQEVNAGAALPGLYPPNDESKARYAAAIMAKQEVPLVCFVRSSSPMSSSRSLLSFVRLYPKPNTVQRGGNKDTTWALTNRTHLATRSSPGCCIGSQPSWCCSSCRGIVIAKFNGAGRCRTRSIAHTNRSVR